MQERARDDDHVLRCGVPRQGLKRLRHDALVRCRVRLQTQGCALIRAKMKPEAADRARLSQTDLFMFVLFCSTRAKSAQDCRSCAEAPSTLSKGMKIGWGNTHLRNERTRSLWVWTLPMRVNIANWTSGWGGVNGYERHCEINSTWLWIVLKKSIGEDVSCELG